MTQPAQARRQRDDRGSTCHVGGHLDHVQQIDRRRGAETAGLVAGEEVRRRSPPRLLLEIDVKRASGTVGLHNVQF